jgi:hypothetical protein
MRRAAMRARSANGVITTRAACRYRINVRTDNKCLNHIACFAIARIALRDADNGCPVDHARAGINDEAFV